MIDTVIPCMVMCEIFARNNYIETAILLVHCTGNIFILEYLNVTLHGNTGKLCIGLVAHCQCGYPLDVLVPKFSD
jgi:hypothetical protein